MRVKVFSLRLGGEERPINKWLEENEGKIKILDKQVRAAASTGGHYITIVFFYEEK